VTCSRCGAENARAQSFVSSAANRSSADVRSAAWPQSSVRNEAAHLEAVAVGIAGQRDAAELRKPFDPALDLRAQAERLGHHEHARPAAGLRFVEAEKSAQIEIAVALFEAFRFHVDWLPWGLRANFRADFCDGVPFYLHAARDGNSDGVRMVS
jgi:hypothetical protein